MIRFEFTVTEEEAQTLFDLVSDGAIMASVHAQNEKRPEAERKWFQQHSTYLKQLRAKMLNKKADKKPHG